MPLEYEVQSEPQRESLMAFAQHYNLVKPVTADTESKRQYLMDFCNAAEDFQCMNKETALFYKRMRQLLHTLSDMQINEITGGTV